MMNTTEVLTPTESVKVSISQVGDEWASTRVIDVDVAIGIPSINDMDEQSRPIHTARVMVRAFDESLGTVVVSIPAGGMSAASLAECIDAELGYLVRDRFIDAHVRESDFADALPISGASVEGPAPFQAHRDVFLASAPPVTVAICTRERPEALRSCLKSVLALRYPDLEIVVVDNAPSSRSTHDVVTGVDVEGRVRYVEEPRAGVSWARNRAVAEASRDIIAFLDDDEVADPYWLAELVRALEEVPNAEVVSGPMVAAEIATKAQAWFEMYGGHNKGKANSRRIYGPEGDQAQNAYYPLPPFGTGGNMAFRRSALERVNGFDTALGAGSPAAGAEDTMAFTRILVSHGTMVYQPTAVVWHYHRRDYAALRRQMRGYGSGMTSYYFALLVSGPRAAANLVRLVPRAWHDFLAPNGLRSGSLSSDFPKDLMSANREGLIRGPWLYVRGRLAARRLRRQELPA